MKSQRILGLLVIFVVGIFESVGFTQYRHGTPMIGIFEICVDTINQQMNDTKGHNPLTKEVGFVFIPPTEYLHNGYSHGIYVCQILGGAFSAVEARCPRCYYENEDDEGTISVNITFGTCNKCGARADGIILYGGGNMTFYDHGYKAPAVLNTYVVEEIKKGKKLYLKIKNAPKHEDWKIQPENQKLLDKAYDTKTYVEMIMETSMPRYITPIR